MPPRALHRLLIVLLVLTAVALLWNAFGMNSTMVIDGRSALALTAVDDRSSGAGTSVATASRADGGLQLDCRIGPGDARPWCELQVLFQRAPQGIDLSRFDTVRLWVTASGPEPRQSMRVSVRNFDPAYSKVGDDASEKVDQLVYAPADYPAGVELPLSRFTVAPGWLVAHPMTLEREAPQFDNVTRLAFATGPVVQPGLHTLRIDRIELRGRLVPTSAFRLGIIAAWMLSVLGFLAIERLLTRSKLRLSAASQSSLQRLNESLQMETRSLARIARTDALTGLLNRKGLADELTRLVRMGGDIVFPLTLVFIDIDHFKRVNAGHGHAVGDQVIRGLVELVKVAVQRDDLFARWGGEEFLLVFRNTSGVDGRVIAERLRERIAGAQWPDGLQVTCSFGVAEWHKDEDLTDGIRRADDAMYRAKHEGRNRVELELERQPHADSQPA